MKNLSIINNMEELIHWLEKFDINYQIWGQNLSKSSTNLLEEIHSGECVLLNNLPLRIVHVVQLIIFQDKKILVEKEQVFCDNRNRPRLAPPSEKMKSNENVKDTAFRCLDEELQLSMQDVDIIATETKPKIRNRISTSYPGLRSRYYLFRVIVSTKKLPHNDFWTHEKNDPFKKHLIIKHKWGWVNPRMVHINPEMSSFESE